MVERIKVENGAYEVQDYILWHIANIINALANADEEDLGDFVPVEVELTSGKYSYCHEAIKVVQHALDLLGYEAPKPIYCVNLNSEENKYNYLWKVTYKIDTSMCY